jgi:putative spermidine/putrescine transport system permease protein
MRRALTTPAVLVAAVFAAGMAMVFQYSLRSFIPGSMEVGGLTAENFTTLAQPRYAWVLVQTVRICAETALAALILGYPLAYALATARSRLLKSFILVTALTPMFLGEIVRTYAWIIVLGRNGFINWALLRAGLVDEPLEMMFTEAGVVVALVHVTLPVMVVMLAAGLSHIDPVYARAATGMGAGRLRTFLAVTLPLSMPGVVIAFTTGFAWTFSAFATPQIIGGGKVPMVSTLVYQLGLASFNFPFAAALSLVGLGLALGALAVLRRVLAPVSAWGGM